MFNCVVIKINSRPVMVLHTIDQANVLRKLMEQEGMPWHGMPVFIDWAYIPNLPF